MENIRVSMYRERQRLICENAESPGSSLGRESIKTQSTATAEWLVTKVLTIFICWQLYISQYFY